MTLNPLRALLLMVHNMTIEDENKLRDWFDVWIEVT